MSIIYAAFNVNAGRIIYLREENRTSCQNKVLQKKDMRIPGIKTLIERIPEALRRVLFVFLVVRIAASFAAVVSVSSIPSNPIVAVDYYAKNQYPKLMEMTTGVWERSDALWYISIAQNGYGKDSRGAVFLPLYPLTIRLIWKLTKLRWIVSALIASNIFYIFALYFLYKLCENEKGQDVAYKTIWYQALFPGSVFFLAPYSESLYLALSAGSFLAARKRLWWLAAILAALLGATRNMGILIMIPLFIEFIRQRKEGFPVKWHNVFWLLLIPLGILSVMAYWNNLSGDPLAFVHRQIAWQREFMMPWKTLISGVTQAWNMVPSPPGGVLLLETFAVFFTVIIGIVSIFKIPVPYTVFLWLNFLPPLCSPYSGRVFMSCVRFISVLFPVFITLACLARSEKADHLIKVMFAGFFILSVALYVTSQSMY